jgi:hypothetical protein
MLRFRVAALPRDVRKGYALPGNIPKVLRLRLNACGA